MGSCPRCGGPGVPMGALGNRYWSRCRYCGWEFSEVIIDIEAKDVEEDEQVESE